MASARETYKDILIQSKPVDALVTFTSKSVNVQGRMKSTFLVFCSVNCTLAVEWSYANTDDPGSWLPLHGLEAVPVVGGRVLRITVDDALTYLRIAVSGFVGAGQLSAWTIAI